MEAQHALINIVCASGFGGRLGCVIAETTATGPKVGITAKRPSGSSARRNDIEKMAKMTRSLQNGGFQHVTGPAQIMSCVPPPSSLLLSVADSIANWIILLRVPKKLNVALYSLFCRAFELPETKYEDFHCRLGFMCVGGGCLCSLLGSLLLRSSIGGWRQ